MPPFNQRFIATFAAIMTTVLIQPSCERWRQFIEQLPQTFERLGEVIYDKRNQIRVIPAPDDGTLLNVKRYCVPRQPNRLIYSLGIRQPKGKRAYRYPTLLLERGIDTPAPVAYIEQRNRLGLLQHTYLVTMQSDLRHTLYEVGNAQAGTYEQLADHLGEFTAHMHDQQVLHLDYSPGNILWDRDIDGRYRFAIVDINRMRFGHVNARQGCEALRRLWGPKRFVELTARSYARHRGIDPDQAVALTMQARAQFWQRYSRRHTVEFDLEL